MKSTKRSERRFHADRLKKKRKNHYSWRNKTPRDLGVLLHTATLCSCPMCGNPRRTLREDSLYEMSDAEVLEYELEELRSGSN